MYVARIGRTKFRVKQKWRLTKLDRSKVLIDNSDEIKQTVGSEKDVT